jgi:hypothetical protein
MPKPTPLASQPAPQAAKPAPVASKKSAQAVSIISQEVVNLDSGNGNANAAAHAFMASLECRLGELRHHLASFNHVGISDEAMEVINHLKSIL